MKQFTPRLSQNWIKCIGSLPVYRNIKETEEQITYQDYNAIDKISNMSSSPDEQLSMLNKEGARERRLLELQGKPGQPRQTTDLIQI